MAKLNEKHAALTRQLVLDAAVELIKDCDVSELSLKKIAEHAGMAERTLYRHFATRNVFIEALAATLHERLATPPTPVDAASLATMPELLYRKLEEQPEIVLAILHSELYQYIFGTAARDRWLSIKNILNDAYPNTPDQLREMSAANIRYYLSASTWYYYRYNFKFDIETTIQCAELSIEQTLQGLSAYSSSSQVK